MHICDYFVSPGGTSECISLFCGKVDAADVGGVCGLEEEAEDIRVIVVPVPEALAQLQAGHIRSAAPIIALQWLQLNHDSPPGALGSAVIGSPACLLSTGHDGVLSPLCLQGQGLLHAHEIKQINDAAHLSQEAGGGAVLTNFPKDTLRQGVHRQHQAARENHYLKTQLLRVVLQG